MKELDPKEMVEIVERGDARAAEFLTEKLLEAGITPSRIIEEGLQPGLKSVGDKYAEGVYFLPELFSAGEVAKVVVARLKPHAGAEEAKNKSVIVVGTVQGDIHSIGMDLVAAILEGAGHNVTNLGVNVSAEEFIDAVKVQNAHIVGMSALLTTTMPYMKTVIGALEQSGLRHSVRVIIGGAPVDDAYAKEIGADAYGKDAREALRKVEELTVQRGGG